MGRDNVLPMEENRIIVVNEAPAATNAEEDVIVDTLSDVEEESNEKSER